MNLQQNSDKIIHKAQRTSLIFFLFSW